MERLQINLKQNKLDLNASNEIEVFNTISGDLENLIWNGPDGPLSLEDTIGDLDFVAQELFGLSKEEALIQAKNIWEPYINGGEKEAKRLIISGATDKIGAREGEIHYLGKSGNVIGINANIEARELALANPGDIAFGGTDENGTWNQVAKVRPDVETHILGNGEFNYNSHRLLSKALSGFDEQSNSLVDREIQIMANAIAQDPDIVVQIYASDEENELFLLFLHKEVNKIRKEMGLSQIDKLKVDANSAEVTKKLANKGHLYPKPEDVIDLQLDSNTYESWLEAEGALSPIERDLGEKTPRMPGYHIIWEKDFDKFSQRATLAIDLLENRWGSDTNFFKNVEGSDGAGAFKIDQTKDREKIIQELYEGGHDWVIEPFVNYRKMKVQGKGVDQVRSVAPSIHVRGGKAYDTKLVQIMVSEEDENGNIKETTEWGGHVYAPKDFAAVGMSKDECEIGIPTLKKMTEVYGSDGFSRGGIDMALGTIQTKWGEKNVNALQDMNIRTNGGDTARGFGKMVEREFGEEKPFATVIMKPNIGVKFEQVNEALDEIAGELEIDRKFIKLLTVVPPGGGMFGVISDTPNNAFVDAIRIEKELKMRKILR